MVFQGPIKPGTSEEAFRETGKSVNLFQGPVRPGTDVKYFRRTGTSRSSSGSGSSKQLGPTRAEFEAEAERKQAEILKQEQLKRQQAEAKKLADQIKADKEQKAFGQTIGGQVEVSSVRNKYGQIGDTGKVKIGDHTYIGSSYIDELGQTADQYARSVKAEAISQGLVSKRDVNRSRFSFGLFKPEEYFRN